MTPGLTWTPKGGSAAGSERPRRGSRSALARGLGLLLAVGALAGGACTRSDAPAPPPAPAGVASSGTGGRGAPPAAAPSALAPSTGDLPEIQKRGVIRFLVTAADYLQRARDPKAAEQELAMAFAKKLNLRGEAVVVTDRSELISRLDAGHGDVIVASLAITPERSGQLAFTRPIRFVKQQVVVRASDRSFRKLGDLAGKTVTVRASSSYAATLKTVAAGVKGLRIKHARETEDTFDLIQKVARGEEQATVADSDILAAASTFEPRVKAAFNLTDRDPIAWGIRKGNPALKAALDSFLVEHALTGHQERGYRADLPEIKKRGVLRVLTRNTSTTYFLYRGEQLGFEYELASEFAKELGVRLELVVPPSREALATYLRAGRGDMVAAGLTVTAERRREFAFSTPYNHVSELLVVPAKDTQTQGLDDLRGRKIAVRRSSSYYQSLAVLRSRHGFEIELAPEDQETEDILDAVGEGRYAATVADSNIVDLELTFSDAIRSVGPIGEVGDIAWLLRRDQPRLKAAADAFIKKIYRGTFYNMTVAKYFKNPKQIREATSEQRSDRSGQLSPYDGFTKKYARQYEFDWRLVTSQMYQESRFDPRARSWVGALGVMQVMPKTAQELGIDNVLDPERGIHAGVKLLARYAEMFKGPTVSERDRIYFTLAAYNCGPGHVLDGRRLAADLRLDPDRWFGQVERAMRELSKPKVARRARHGYCRCDEPVRYVSEIQSRYQSYAKLVDLN